MMDNLVGLDISLTSTGISTWAGESNVFTQPSEFSHPIDRYRFIRSSIAEVLSQDILHEGEVPVVAIEGYAFSKRSSHAHAQGELGGIVRLWLRENSFPYVEVPPMNLKKFVTGKGNATKSDMVSSVTLRTGVEWAGKGSEDRVDAWGLRQMLLAHHDSPEYAWPAKNMEALDKIDWDALG